MNSQRKFSFLKMATMLLLCAFALPTGVDAQRNDGDRPTFRNTKKCEKFVNCHDARDGRWDGRGPRPETTTRYRARRQREWNNNHFRRMEERHDHRMHYRYTRRHRQ